MRIKECIAFKAVLITQEQLKYVLGSLENGCPPRHEYPRRLFVQMG
jgi:hypothetical protein